ncbi:unnamed protein product [Staurois parvus]|uniref:Uncharacterized protein n=1 Tax=Staurois parvus TaxID=386267 RepID=A0ABN9A8K5_9NEOB|nr:unnamed protein product [Staurois parvus]
MMENRPPLTSPDGSSNGNPPERCPRPLYSRDSTQDHQEIPQEDQMEGMIVVKVEDEEEAGDGPCMEGDGPCMEGGFTLIFIHRPRRHQRHSERRQS